MSESTEMSPSWEDVKTHYIGANLIAWLFYVIFGTIGNGLVIAIYRKQHKLTGRVYILLLAGIDLTACLFVVPQATLYFSELQGSGLATFRIIYIQESIVMIQSYIFVQNAMALDQFLAVFYPTVYKKRRRKMNNAMLVICLCLVPLFITQSTFIKHQGDTAAQLGILFALPPLISLMTMLLVYPAIARKLYKQHRAVQPAKNKERQRKATVGKSLVTSTANELTTRATITK